MEHKTVYIVLGPTAVGKTDVAIRLAQRLSTGIISADSRQCYIEMNIGTARPDSAQLSAVPHHFIAEFPVTRALSAADFEEYALQHLDTIFQNHNTAVVCGGTGLYIDALCKGLDPMPAVPDSVRDAVRSLYALEGLTGLQTAISAEDPAFFAAGEIQNPHRVMRALEFVRATRTSILLHRTGAAVKRPFRFIKIGLNLDRDTLYARINHRVGVMMNEGLLEEARALYPLRQLKNLQTVGYSELFEHFSGLCSLPEAVDKIRQHTRNYAKRQLTWFRRDPEVHWFSPADVDLIDNILNIKPDA